MDFAKLPKKLGQNFSKGTLTTESPTLEVLITELTKHLANIQKDDNALLVTVNLLVDLIKELQNSQGYLKEETNTLWWLFAGYSEILSKKFSELSAKELTIIIPVELEKLTYNLPGLGKIDSLISKALTAVETQDDPTVSLEQIVTSISSSAEQIALAMPKPDTTIAVLTPFVNAISCFVEFTGAEWKGVYNKKNNVNLASQLSLTTFANQLYQELMLVRVFNEIA